MTAATPKGLHAKLAEVMAEAGRIPKNGRAPQQMGGFEFVQVGDAADAIRKALGERGVSMLPTAVEVLGESDHQTRSGGTMTTQTVRTTWTLTDGETGQSAVIQSLGTGADSGDKFSPKAQTNAMKYALLMGFLLSTGDDPEQSDTSDRQAPVAETETLLGRATVTGKATKGGSTAYMGDWRETPDGHAIGFKLTRSGDKDVPQVLVTMDVGSALFAADPGATFMGQQVTVSGRMYAVQARGRTTYNRLVVGEAVQDYIETPDWRIPAIPPSEPEPEQGDPAPAAPPEAESLPAWDLASVDAEDRVMAGQG